MTAKPLFHGNMEGPREALAATSIQGGYWTLAGLASRYVLQIVVLLILARLLTPLEFGVVGAALIFVNASSVLAQAGAGAAIIQHPSLEKGHLRAAFGVSVFVGMALGALVWFSAPFVQTFFNMSGLREVLQAMALLFPLGAIGAVSEAKLQRARKFGSLAKIEFAASATGFGMVGIGLALMGAGVWALVGAYVARTAVRSGALIVSDAPSIVPVWRRRQMKDLLGFGAGYTLARLGNYIAGQGDKLVVGRVLGAASLGLYGRAFEILMLPVSLVGSAIDRVMFPTFATIQGNQDRLRTSFGRGLSAIALTMLPLSGFVILIAPELVLVLLGSNWTGLTLPFQILASGLLFRTGYKLGDSVLRATGRVYSQAWRHWLYALLVVVGAFAGSHWGLPGVAAGVLGAIIIHTGFILAFASRVAGLGWPAAWRAHQAGLLTLLCVSATTAGVAALSRHFGMEALVTLIAAAVMAVAVTLALVRSAKAAKLLGADGTWVLRNFEKYSPFPLNVLFRLHPGKEV